jgi:type II secretory ATPase GspE/PulE/Tfp pilus assembly ATPase PilB-like protein/CheY-like chemotaxis protein
MSSARHETSWLLHSLRRAGNPAALSVDEGPKVCAWKALQDAGMSVEEIAAAACAASGAQRAAAAELDGADASLLPASLARTHRLVPLYARRGVLVVATSNPLAPSLDDQVRFATRLHVEARVATPAEVDAALARLYTEAADRPAPAFRGAATATEWNDRIVDGALAAGASDIHIEPQADGSLMVRYRVDGALYEELAVPADAALSVVSRLKIMAGLDIADRIRPQDGRSSVQRGGRTLDLRISTLPLDERGEKIVVRILGGHGGEAGLAGLGFLPAERFRLEKLLGQRDGMLLVTGPTGSGKTTTLYSALAVAQTAETNVVTVEDPIEYRLAGVNQVQVNEKAGLTFATALRSLLRQDPDIILVGEIRDPETAAIAVKASMTGHLVLSTLHTNDAASAVHRLLDLGVDPTVLSASLKGVVAQRLIRKLCAECSEPVALSEMAADHQMILMGKKTDRLRRATGCASCRGTGYSGRMVVPEVLLVTPEVSRALARGTAAEIGDLAREGGMLSMWDAGLARVLEGLTSLHELIDNIAAPLDAAAVGTQDSVDALLASLLGGAAAALPPVPAAPPVPIRAARPVESAPCVLVVDDDRSARRELRRVLEGEGFRVIEAADGEAGVAYALRLKPRAVVTEIVMPRLDGLGVLQALAGATPVLVYTHESNADMLEWATELGAAGVLSKTTDGRFVAARLADLLSAGSPQARLAV